MTPAHALALAAALAAAPLVAEAAAISLPAGAELRANEVAPAGHYAMPIAPWTEAGGIPTLALSGKVTRQAWRLGGTGLSSYQIMLSLRGQLVKAGYEMLMECSTAECGGFDFRYGTEVIGEPSMHVDLGDFYYLAAKKPGEDEAVSLLVSRSASAGFVQLVEVGEMSALPAAAAPPAVSTKADPDVALPAVLTGDVGTAMEQIGRFVMGDLVFATGSSDLGPGKYDSLEELAAFLKSNPQKRVALVGHTDAQGSLSGNISLSQRRAQSVMARLVNDYGVPAAQLEAEGIGYLAPIASNQTEEGRTANRRVEAILVSTD